MRAGLFPGQGIPARVVLDALPSRHAVLDMAREVLGYDVRKRVEIAARREGAMLPTALAQPAIYAAGLIAHQERGRPLFDAFVGHSVGEYTALVAAGSMSPEQGFAIVRVRADAMEAASRAEKGGMAAVLRLDFETVSDVARRAEVHIANDNAPGQVVLAGSEAGLTTAASLVRAAKGRSVLLETAGAFHTHAMASARNALKAALDGAEISMPAVPVVANVSARPYGSAQDVREGLVEQLTGRVRFRESLEWLWARGIREFDDLGPGQIVGGLASRTFRELARSDQPEAVNA
jgi:[acyl-carrier-protein] S-malonyltransferase